MKSTVDQIKFFFNYPCRSDEKTETKYITHYNGQFNDFTSKDFMKIEKRRQVVSSLLCKNDYRATDQ